MSEHEIRAALDRHWVASDASDFAVEHDIYRDDAVLEYPQSGERISGRHNIQASRTAQPNLKRFSVRRIVGAGELWVTEFILTYMASHLTPSASWSFGMARWRGRRSISATHLPPVRLARRSSSGSRNLFVLSRDSCLVGDSAYGHHALTTRCYQRTEPISKRR